MRLNHPASSSNAPLWPDSAPAAKAVVGAVVDPKETYATSQPVGGIAPVTVILEGGADFRIADLASTPPHVAVGANTGRTCARPVRLGRAVVGPSAIERWSRSSSPLDVAATNHFRNYCSPLAMTSRVAFSEDEA